MIIDINGWRGLPLSLVLLGVFTGLAAAGNFSVSATAFPRGQAIPPQFAYAKQNLSPALQLSDIPSGTQSLVLIMDDPDSPSGLWTHWLVWNIPADTTSIPEAKLPPKALVGKNSFDDVAYDGPAPPAGTHRYFFHVYALDTVLSLPAGSDRASLEKAMQGHVLGTAETFGTYEAP